jgi:multiple sugar transport system permease protein
MEHLLRRPLRIPSKRVVFHLFVWAFGFVMVYPVLWMIANSFKTSAEIFGSASLLPQDFTLDNYVRGWQYTGSARLTFARFFLNSTFYSVLATVAAVFSSSLIAFGFARIRFAGSKVLYGCMIATMLIPFQVLMVPQYIIFHKLGWVNTFLPLIVPMAGGFPFFIFLMVQFIRQIPIELDNSAKIDGCSRLQIYSRIILPLIKPALITSTIFSFYWRWDDFIGPLLYLNRPRLYTVSLALRMFSDPQTATDWPAIFAMGTLSLVPIVIIFFIFQKYIVQGITTTGFK